MVVQYRGRGQIRVGKVSNRKVVAYTQVVTKKHARTLYAGTHRNRVRHTHISTQQNEKQP